MERLPDGFLRVGIELPDGTRVSNLGRPRVWANPHAQQPTGPVLLRLDRLQAE